MARVLDIGEGPEGERNEFSSIIKSRSGKLRRKVAVKSSGGCPSVKTMSPESRNQTVCFVQVHLVVS